MSAGASIVCVGTAALDTIALVDRLPASDERIEAHDLVTAGGGNAATSAVAIARLGLPVEFSGIVGDDEAGATVIAQLRAEGVGTSLVERRPGVSTAQSLIVVSKDSGARAIIAKQATSPSVVPPGFDWVHLDKSGYQALLDTGDISSRISLDDGNIIPDLDLALIDLYVPTVAVLQKRFPGTDAVTAARKALAAGSRTVVATSGSAGSFAADEAALHFAPAIPVDVVSTLGAGDVFHGALLAAIVLGKPLPEAIRFANITAALSCRHLDGRSAIPTRDEVEAVLSSMPVETLPDSAIAAHFGAAT